MDRSNLVLRNTAYSCLAVFLIFAVAYVPMLLKIGYNYDLQVASVVVFMVVGLSVNFGLFRGGVGESKVAGRVRVVFGLLVLFVFLEEVLLNSMLAFYGLALAIMGLVLMPVLAVSLGRENGWLRTALEAVALVFATRVVLSPFPADFFNLSMFLPVIYTLIIVSLALYMTYRGILSRDVRISKGNSKVGTQMFYGLCAGAFVGVVEFFVLRPQPIPVGGDFIRVFVYSLIVMGVMVSVAEELLFRGLLQGSLERVMPAWQAIGFSSIMFGLMHIGWMNPLEVLLAYGAGVLFGYMATSTGSLIAPVTAHASGNLLLYVITFFVHA